jgi:hypothetical protein
MQQHGRSRQPAKGQRKTKNHASSSIANRASSADLQKLLDQRTQELAERKLED